MDLAGSHKGVSTLIKRNKLCACEVYIAKGLQEVHGFEHGFQVVLEVVRRT